jgi:RimJ/RimL family protein N-acetyltransferase
MNSNLSLIELHVEALFVHDESGRLVKVNEPAGGPAPRFYLGRTSEGIIRRFRYDLEEALVTELNALCDHEDRSVLAREPTYAKEYESLLDGGRASAGPAFVFEQLPVPTARDVIEVTGANKRMLSRGLDAWMIDVERGSKLFALVADGRAVSVCASVRETPFCHEAGVETLSEYRGRGFAADTVSAWARDTFASNLIPLYSTSWENKASRRVAMKLGLRMYGSDFHVQ